MLVYSANQLAHHGVLGMKWGVRNGPPYPLSSNGPTNRKEADDRKMVGGDIEAIITTVTALATVSALVFSSVRQKQLEKKATEILTSLEKSSILKMADMPRINSAHDIARDLAAVNPNFNKGVPYQINCSNCTTTYELRRRGYDVEALPRHVPMRMGELMACYKGAKDKVVEEKDKLAALTREVESWGDGARGTVRITMGQGHIGHVFSTEVVDGKAIFIDPQSGKHNGAAMLRKASMASVFRTDNLGLSNDILSTVRKKEG